MVTVYLIISQILSGADIHTAVNLTAVSAEYLASHTVSKSHSKTCLSASSGTKYGYKVKICHIQCQR